MRSLFLLVTTLFCFGAFAAPTYAGLSASRKPNESYDQASSRSRTESDMLHISDTQNDTPGKIQVTFDKLDFSDVPELPSKELLDQEFRFVRDTRFMQDTSLAFPRRLTWLYPDDGCFARAELATQFSVKMGLPAPKKFFAFGNLSAQTPNAPGGLVTWWYHVAPIYRVKKDVYVLDPAVNPKRALLIHEWVIAITGSEKNPHFAVCSSATYDPDFSCSTQESNPLDNTVNDELSYMTPEWNRLVDLGRNPQKELGDNPPWLTRFAF